MPSCGFISIYFPLSVSFSSLKYLNLCIICLVVEVICTETALTKKGDKMEQLTTKTFKDYNFDDWFVLGASLIIGVGVAILFVTIYNSIK
jgi:hypothetical protein